MNEQIFTEVLNDILDELQQANRSLKTLQTTINDLQEKTTGFEQKLIDQQVIAPPADTTPIQELTEKAISTIRQDVKKQLDVVSSIVEAQPKNVIKQWRLCFFPENDYQGNYKLLINKITLVVLGIAFIVAGYFLILHNMDKPDTASPGAAQGPGVQNPPPAAGNASAPSGTKTSDHPPATKKADHPAPAAKNFDQPQLTPKNLEHPFPITKNQERHKIQQEIRKQIDTLYKMYIHKSPDSL